MTIKNYEYFPYFSKNIFEEQYNAIQIEQNIVKDFFIIKNNEYFLSYFMGKLFYDLLISEKYFIMKIIFI